jgi:serine phosphatase RsbU (regulator of sigma subunit)
MLRGEYTLTAAGKERHFKLCTLSDNLFCQYEGVKLSEYLDRIKNPIGFTQLNLIYSQAVAYAKINKQPIDFTVEDVSVWIDEVGESAFEEKLQAIAKAQIENIEADIEKNRPAPVTGQSGNGKIT